MPHHDIQSVGSLLEIIHEELLDLHRKVNQMSIDISKLTASEQKLIAVVDQVLVIVGNQQSALKTLSDQLAAAIAASDPINMAALQQAIDTMSATLDAETTKVGVSLAAAAAGVSGASGPSGVTGPSSASPTGGTGPAGPGDTQPSTTPTTGSTGSSGPQPTGTTGSDAPLTGPTPTA